jgi:hypothetical protein
MRRRLFTVGPDHEPLRLRFYVQPYGTHWAAMLVADEATPPGPVQRTGLGLMAMCRMRLSERRRSFSTRGGADAANG